MPIVAKPTVGTRKLRKVFDDSMTVVLGFMVHPRLDAVMPSPR